MCIRDRCNIVTAARTLFISVTVGRSHHQTRHATACYCILYYKHYQKQLSLPLSCNKSVQTNLGAGPRRSESLPRDGLITTTKVPAAVDALSHRYAAKSPLVTMARSKFALPKLLLLVDRSPNSSTCRIHGPVRPTMSNGIRMRSAVLPQCTGQIDRHNDRQTNIWLTGMVCDYRPLSLYGQQRGLIMAAVAY